MRYAQTLSVYIIYSNEAVYYPSYAGIIRIRSEGIISAAPKQERHPWLFDFNYFCSRCDKFAAEWAPVAQELWESREHPHPKTQYYRDTPEGKAELREKK